MNDDVETRAQQRHNRVHRAGTAPVCGACRDHADEWDIFCRDVAAGLARPTLAQRIAYPRRPQLAGLLACAAVVTFTCVAWIPGLPAPVFAAGWFTALGVLLLAIRWFILADRQQTTQT